MKLALWFKTLLTLAGPVLLLALIVGLVLLAWPTPASAAGPVVTTAEDEAGDCATGTGCSLREAIAAADAGDTITFAGNYTIYLTSTLIITKELTIDGSGHTVTISGDTGGNGTADVRVFSIGSSSVATLTHLNIVSGTTGSGSTCPDYCGGGVYIATGGTLTVLTSTLTGNSAGYRGGGLYNDGGTLTVKASTFSGNSVTYFGGGLYNNGGTVTVQTSTFSGNRTTYTPYGGYGGGGIYNTGGMTIENSTIAGNSAPSNTGGGIYNDNSGKVLTVKASTISGNSGDYAGGIANISGSLDLVQTIIANSASGYDCSKIGGTVFSRDSLFEATGWYACGVPGDYNTLLGVDPLLSPLGDYGGSTQTFALLPGSPAIDFIKYSGCLPTDQRGVSRPVGTTCDIGAFESRGFNLAVSGGNNQSTPLNTAFTEPLSVTVNSVDGAPVGSGVVVTYTAPATPGSASLSTTSLTATTTAAGAAEVSVAANEVAGSYTVVVTAPWASAPVNFNLTNLAPDLALTKTVSPAVAAPGQAITYTLTFSNAGHAPANSVVITDSLPVSLTNLSVSSSGATITAHAGSRYVWDVVDLAAGQGGVITVSGVLSRPLAAGVFTNTATIAASNDSNAANNTARVGVTVSYPTYLPVILK